MDWFGLVWFGLDWIGLVCTLFESVDTAGRFPKAFFEGGGGFASSGIIAGFGVSKLMGSSSLLSSLIFLCSGAPFDDPACNSADDEEEEE